jgi:hypothetical protein
MHILTFSLPSSGPPSALLSPLGSQEQSLTRRWGAGTQEAEAEGVQGTQKFKASLSQKKKKPKKQN